MIRRIQVAATVVAMTALAACGGGGDDPQASTEGDGATTISTAATPLGTVLTGAKGYTLYMFGSDTPTTSACEAADGCSKTWPPATGAPRYDGHETLPGKLGSLKRSDGTTQITYQGHALYTYAEDKGPGQTRGENVGNLWHVVKTDTAMLTADGAGGSSEAPPARDDSY